MNLNSLTIEKIAKLHDGYIEMGTQLILLSNIVESLPRRREPRPPIREPRSDKASIMAAKSETYAGCGEGRVMGKRFVQHSDMCGCERCAVQWDREFPQPVFDAVEDPNILECGCEVGYCRCWDDDGSLDRQYDEEEAARDRREAARDAEAGK